jgi:hypothetical protein
MVEGVAGYSVLRYRGLVFCSEVGRSTVKADVEVGIIVVQTEYRECVHSIDSTFVEKYADN